MRIEIENAAQAIGSSSDACKNIVFICTHNSRRSQLAAFWAQYWADELGMDYSFFSAGTEKTSVYPTILDALEHMNISIDRVGDSFVAYTSKRKVPLFSKTLEDPTLPKQYHAITTCSDADENCPFLPEAVTRSHIPYEDPKWSDGHNEELEVYSQNSEIIRNEMRELLITLQEN